MSEPEDACALADRIRSGATTARAVMAASLARVEACASLGAVRFVSRLLQRHCLISLCHTLSPAS